MDSVGSKVNPRDREDRASIEKDLSTAAERIQRKVDNIMSKDLEVTVVLSCTSTGKVSREKVLAPETVRV